MARKAGRDGSKILRFPIERRERSPLELLAQLAPSRSLVETLIAERGEAAHDAQAGFAREFAHQARALERGCGRDEAIMRMRVLVDAHVAHAIEVCRAFQDTADRLISVEVRVTREARIPVSLRLELDAARADFRGCAIAARAVADAAQGAASALATYIRDGLGALPVSATEPKQLVLFAQATA